MNDRIFSKPIKGGWVHQVALAAIRGYQNYLSPALPPRCRFHPSCSQYAEGCFKGHSVPRATWLVVKRLLKCHPYHPGGIDLVPRPKGPEFGELVD